MDLLESASTTLFALICCHKVRFYSGGILLVTLSTWRLVTYHLDINYMDAVELGHLGVKKNYILIV